MAWSEFYWQTTGDNLNAGSTNADAAVFTSAAGNWDGTSIFTPTTGATTSALVAIGDWVSIYATGATSAVYVAQVTAVGAGANGTITLSTTNKIGTAPTTGTGNRAAKAGGAWGKTGASAADLGILTSLFVTGTVAVATRVNVKAGVYANTTVARTFGTSGAQAVPLWWRGYKTTPGDQDTNNVAVAGTDIPSFTWTTVGATAAGSHQTWSNIDFTSASTTAATFNATGFFPRTYRCRFTATGANALSKAYTASNSAAVLVGCYLTATSSSTVLAFTGNHGTAIGCYIVGGAIGITTASGSTGNVIVHCVIDSPAGDGISIAGSTWVINCSLNVLVGNGINLTTVSTSGNSIVNCLFRGNNTASKSAINNTSGTNSNIVQCIGNGYYRWVTNASGITETFAIFDQGTLASDPFTAAGAGDFSVTTIAAAKAVPGPFENTSAFQGYLDLGAVQRQASGGSANVAY